MNEHRTLQYMAWLTILFLLSIAASCEIGRQQQWPERVDNGSIRHSAGYVLEKL